MRIITEGTVPGKENEVKKTCYNCQIRFAYTKSDVKSDRDGRYVKCPGCESFIAVN